MTGNWLRLDDLSVKGKKPWFKKTAAIVLTILSVLISGCIYFPLLIGIFQGVKAFWIPSLVACFYYFFWSYPRQLAAIITAVLIWVVIGPGIAGVWIWGLLKIFSLTGGDWLASIILALIWTTGPIALGKKILDKFGIIAIAKRILKKRFIK